MTKLHQSNLRVLYMDNRKQQGKAKRPDPYIGDTRGKIVIYYCWDKKGRSEKASRLMYVCIDDILIECIFTLESGQFHNVWYGHLFLCIQLFGSLQLLWVHGIDCLWSATLAASCSRCV